MSDPIKSPLSVSGKEEERPMHDRDDRLRRKIEELERVVLGSVPAFGIREAASGVVNAWRDIHPKESADVR